MHPIESPPAPPKHSWIYKLGMLLFIIVCFEVGAFLIVFPWTQQWDGNSVGHLFPWLSALWSSSYFRGALSGLGLLNIYISLGDVLRLRRENAKLPPADKLKASTL
jgi:hypothetical protein